MAVVHFVVEVSKSCAKKWKLFVRVSVDEDDRDSCDHDANPIRGYVGLFVVKQQFPVSIEPCSNRCKIQLGKTHSANGKCVMDKNTYIADIDQDCVIYLQWGQDVEPPQVELSPHDNHVAICVSIQPMAGGANSEARNGVVVLTVYRLYCAPTLTQYGVPRFQEDGFQWDQYEGGSLMYHKQYVNDNLVLWGERDEMEKRVTDNGTKTHDDTLVLLPVFRYELRLQKPEAPPPGPHNVMKSFFMKTKARTRFTSSPCPSAKSRNGIEPGNREAHLDEAQKTIIKVTEKRENVNQESVEIIKNATSTQMQSDGVDKKKDKEDSKASTKQEDNGRAQAETEAQEENIENITQKPQSKSSARRRRKRSASAKFKQSHNGSHNANAKGDLQEKIDERNEQQWTVVEYEGGKRQVLVSQSTSCERNNLRNRHSSPRKINRKKKNSKGVVYIREMETGSVPTDGQTGKLQPSRASSTPSKPVKPTTLGQTATSAKSLKATTLSQPSKPAMLSQTSTTTKSHKSTTPSLSSAVTKSPKPTVPSQASSTTKSHKSTTPSLSSASTKSHKPTVPSQSSKPTKSVSSTTLSQYSTSTKSPKPTTPNQAAMPTKAANPSALNQSATPTKSLGFASLCQPATPTKSLGFASLCQPATATKSLNPTTLRQDFIAGKPLNSTKLCQPSAPAQCMKSMVLGQTFPSEKSLAALLISPTPTSAKKPVNYKKPTIEFVSCTSPEYDNPPMIAQPSTSPKSLNPTTRSQRTESSLIREIVEISPCPTSASSLNPKPSSEKSDAMAYVEEMTMSQRTKPLQTLEIVDMYQGPTSASFLDPKASCENLSDAVTYYVEKKPMRHRTKLLQTTVEIVDMHQGSTSASSLDPNPSGESPSDAVTYVEDMAMKESSTSTGSVPTDRPSRVADQCSSVSNLASAGDTGQQNINAPSRLKSFAHLFAPASWVPSKTPTPGAAAGDSMEQDPERHHEKDSEKDVEPEGREYVPTHLRCRQNHSKATALYDYSALECEDGGSQTKKPRRLFKKLFGCCMRSSE